MKNMMMRLTKVDEDKRLVTGRATEEVADHDDEILDYKSSKPEFEKWSNDISKASGGKSKGNVRVMHTNKVAGCVNQLFFLDAEKAIDMEVHVVDDAEWKMVKAGGYTGFSIGGSYVRKWKDPDNPELTRFTPRVVEVSLVDYPCVPTATFEAIKADGTRELRKFKPFQESDMAEELKQVWLAKDGSQHEKRNDAIAQNEAVDAAAAVAPAEAALAKLDAALKGEKKEETAEEKAEREKTEGDAKKKKEDAEKAAGESEEGKKAKKAEMLAALKKSLSEAWDARAAIEAICSIEYLLIGEESEDEADQIADLEEAIARLKTFIAAEIMEGSEKVVKAGARHSKGDMENLTKMSDHLHGLHEHMKDALDKCMDMHKCMKGMGMPGHDMEEDAGAEKVAAVLRQNEKLIKQNTAQTEALTKMAARIEEIAPEITRLRDDINTPLVRKSRAAYATGNDSTLKKEGDDNSGQDSRTSYNSNGLSPAEARRNLM